MASTADAAVHLEVRALGKSFGATRALDDVSVAVRAGTVHAFVGENGAGKSTLGKIIAGVFPQDQGDLVLRGTTVTFGSPREALVRGIALVAQEVALVPRLTVAQNVFLGVEPRRAGFIDRGSLRERFDRLIEEAGFDLRADSIVGQPVAGATAAGGDPARARARGGPDRPRRAVGEPLGDRDGATPRGRPRAAGAGPDGHPRLAFPGRGPGALGHRHRPARRSRRADDRDVRGDREQPRHRDAGPAGRPGLSRQAAAAGRCTRRARRRGAHRARGPGRHADAPGGRDRRAGRARRGRPIRAGAGHLRRDRGDGRWCPGRGLGAGRAARARRSTRASR